jgi:hypothetical protein
MPKRKDDLVNPAKMNQLYDTLRAACLRQFGFNPRRITAEMRYVGTEGHGKDLLQIFRAAGSHSQMALKNTYVTLREQQGEKPHWTEAEKAHFKNSDAEIDAEIEAKHAELEYIRHCPLYQDHREQLLSHYKDWPGYQADGPHPREAAKILIQAMTDGHDARLADFAEHLHTQDPEQLAQLLLSPCHLEIEASRLAAK